MGLIDFAAGVGQAGVQLGTDTLRSMVEEEKAARLMEMQQRHAKAMQGEALSHSAEQGRLGREATASEGRLTREHQATLAGNAETAADRRQAAGFTHAENMQINALAHAEYLSDQTRALQERQLGISAGHLRLAREQAAMGKQIIGEDGRIAFVTPDGKGGAQVSGYLKTPDGKDFVAPKNISEAAKLEFSAIGERIKALDKAVLEAVNPAAADRARAEILTLTDRQARILHGDQRAPPGDQAIRDRRAPGGSDASGEAVWQDMKRRGEQAGPMSGPSRFDANGSGYDYTRARAAGMGPTGDGTRENAGHWGSVAPTTPEEKKKLGLPAESYVILKGRNHETFALAVQGEEQRGFKVVSIDGRSYSVPKDWAPDAEPARYEGVGRARRETRAWLDWKEREDARDAERRGAEIRRVRDAARGGMIGGQ